jgi:hypothetical protein
MVLFRHPVPIDAHTRASPQVPHEPAPGIEDRDWHASSRDLAQGLVVQEILETIPAELMPDA